MRRRPPPRRAAAAAVLTVTVLGLSLTGATAFGRSVTYGAAQGGTFGGCFEPPVVDPTIPADMVPSPGQAAANCFAWQEFISLNWPADLATCSADTAVGPEDFGEPADMSPVVWETYKLPEEVFLPQAEKPAPWCEGGPTPGDSAGEAANGAKRLADLTSFDPSLDLDLSEFDEALPTNAWLTSQGGFLTFVEMRMNEEEFEYILDEQLYDAAEQAEVASSPDGLTLPDGSIELKASWVELPDESLYPYFKTREALLHYPDQKEPTEAVVGLVGLHIIHKTPLAQQWVWATFEHRSNAPEVTDLPSPSATPYNYYNPDCDPSTDHYACATNEPPQPTRDPITAPVQVVRENVIPSDSSNDIVDLNDDVQALIGESNPDSVFRNYELVNVLWPSQSTTVLPGSKIPLTQGSAQPTDENVANTTLETYAQFLTCLDCHVAAPIASTDDSLKILQGTRSVGDGPVYAADYSFLLRHAYFPPGAAEEGGPPWALIAAAAAIAAGGAGVAVARGRRRRRVT